MERSTFIKRGALAAGLAMLAAFGCERPNPYKLTGDTTAQENCPPTNPQLPDGMDPSTSGGQGAADPSGGQGASIPDPDELEARVIDYSEALRTAKLKLIGNIPTVNEVYEIANEPEDTQPDKFAEMVDNMLNDPRFAVRMINYWRNVFKIYDDGNPPDIMGTPAPSRETAPVYAAQVVVQEMPWTNLLTATTGTCPSYDYQTDSFVPGDCGNNVTAAGILTDPGIHSVYWGNLAFRRNRFFHETFLCRNANASGGAEPTVDPNPAPACPNGEAAPPNYTSPWPMSSISGECNGGQVDFHDYNTTVVCANCHATWNHRAPLFANFDQFGEYMASPQVLVPVEGSPFAVMSDWLPPGEMTAWKFGMPAANLTELGNVMTDDPDVQSCMIKRVWNYAMSRGDIVINETPVPSTVVADYVDLMNTNGGNLRDVLKAIILSEDFVSF